MAAIIIEADNGSALLAMGGERCERNRRGAVAGMQLATNF
jgi:hypothetical protein